MKKYYIKLKPNQKMSLLNLISNNLKITKDQASIFISQGSVWDNTTKKRIKDKNIIIKNEEICINMPIFPIVEYKLNEKNIKYEDNDLIIIFKEPGIYSCPTPESDINCISWGIQKYFNKNRIKFFASPINRLDKPAQGLMFFAKNKKTGSFLHEMFKNRKIKKLYLAITPKYELKKKELIIKDELVWNNKNQTAISYIKFIKEKNNFFYFIVYPLTGRTHQIRKHFQKYLIPIYGDYMYGNYKNNEELGLICYSYKFKHPYNKKIINIEYLPEKYQC